jgi:hypothetical protein
LAHYCAMQDRIIPRPQPILERAFELARVGAVGSIYELEAELAREGYSTFLQLDGASLRKQLKGMIAEAKRGQPNSIPVDRLNASNDE